MIQCYINGQCLTVNQPIIAADTVDYLTFEIIFRSRDWDNLLVTAKFTQGTTTYEAPVVNGVIERNAHVILRKGSGCSPSWDLNLRLLGRWSLVLPPNKKFYG